MQHIFKNIPHPVVIGVSGGVDSMVLLHLAMQQIPRHAIIVAHFDHGLRDEIANSQKMSIEAAARKYRYQFFAKIYQKYDANALCTAHHADDRIESAMFNLIRGTKFGGLIALKNQDFWEIE